MNPSNPFRNLAIGLRTNPFSRNRKRRQPMAYETMEPRMMLAATVTSPTSAADIGFQFTSSSSTQQTGRAFLDADHNGSKSGSEDWLTNWVVYNDINSNFQRDANEPFARTNKSGWFSINGVSSSSHIRPLVAGNHGFVNRVSAETLANTQQTQVQTYADVAVHDQGSIVVWSSFLQDGSSWGVFGQRYNSTHTKVGSEFQINTTTKSSQFSPAVASFANGDFVVAWQSYVAGEQGWNVVSQMFRSNGTRIGGERIVSSTIAKSQLNPVVTTLDNGNFVVGWRGYGQFNSTTSGMGLFTKVFNGSSGRPVSGETPIAKSNFGSDDQMDIASLSGGRFVVAHQGAASPDNNGVYLGTYNSLGQSLTSKYLVNQAERRGVQYQPAVATDRSDRIFVSWTSNVGDGGALGVFAQVVNPNMTLAGGPIQIAQEWIGHQWRSDIVTTGNGNFVVSWQGRGDTDKDGVFVREFNSAALPLGGALRVSDTSTGLQRFASLASNHNGIVATWHGKGEADGFGVYTRLLQGNVAPIASDFAVGVVPRGTKFSVDATDIISDFGTDVDNVLTSQSVSFGSATVNVIGGNTLIGTPADVGFSYLPGNGASGKFIIDSTHAAAFAGVSSGKLAMISIDFSVSDGQLQDKGMLTYILVGNQGKFDQADFKFLGKTTPDQDVSTEVMAAAGQALFAAAISGAGDISDALALVSFAPFAVDGFAPLLANGMLTTALVRASENSSATATANNFSVASATSDNNSTATATARNDSDATASANFSSISVAIANLNSNSVAASERDSTASSDAANRGNASAVANQNSAAAAFTLGGLDRGRTYNGDASASSTNNSAAEATSETGSSVTAVADDESVATATAKNLSTAVASSDAGSSATAFANDLSVASAEALNGSISNAVSVINSAATASSANGSDALAFAEDGSAAEASADQASSASSTAVGTSSSTANALNASTSTASATETSSATAYANLTSVSNAEAAAASIANSVATRDSSASAVALSGSDALSYADDFTSADAMAETSSSASASGTDSTTVAATASNKSTTAAMAKLGANVLGGATNSSVAYSLGSDGAIVNATADNQSAARAIGINGASTSAATIGLSGADATSFSHGTAQAIASNNAVSTAVASHESAANATAFDTAAAIAFASAANDPGTQTLPAELGESVAENLIAAITADVTVAKAIAADSAVQGISSSSGSALANQIEDLLPSAPIAGADAIGGSNADASASNHSTARSSASDISTSSALASNHAHHVADAVHNSVANAGVQLASGIVIDLSNTGLVINTRANDINVSAGTAMMLPIMVNQSDGKMIQQIVISGLPTGSFMSGGIANADGTQWTFSEAPLPGFTLTTPVNFTGRFFLSLQTFALDHQISLATQAVSVISAVT